MLRLLTKKTSKECIKDFESFFESNVLSKDFTVLEDSVLKSLDNAILLDRKTGSIETDFGVTDILHLSTGCKIILSYLYIQRNKGEYKGVVLDVTECGSNALEILFSLAETLNDDETEFLLRHSNQLEKCQDRDYIINGEHFDNLQRGVLING